MSEPRERWLIVGHGSVGSFVAARVAAGGGSVSVFDPSPRIPISHGEPIGALADLSPVDYAVSCVPPEIAEAVPALVAALLSPNAIFFDWNTVAPVAKQRIRDALPVATIDVALLDSVDASVEHPNLAVSGRRVREAARMLEGLGFKTAIVGEEVGEAAALKYLRSVFMKSLEALVLEYVSLASGLNGAPVVRASLESNLGNRFVAFADLLLTTDRVHAQRRSRELADAVETFMVNGAKPTLASAAVDVLQQAADAWAQDSAPPVGADAHALAAHLRGALWRQ
jgi:3-hydroxyisobutyrate dehydrogenase-like beta-hydroxyacid dehydrogenase